MDQIKGLTQFMGETEDDFNDRLLLMYVNDACYKPYGIDEYIDKSINKNVLYSSKEGWNKRYCKAMGEYWKFLFHSLEYNFYEYDMDEAYTHLKRAYKMGSGDAAAQLGYYYYTGTGVAKRVDKRKACKFFKKAFKKKLFFGEYLYAEALMSDAQDEEDFEEAESYYKAAIDKKLPFAKTKLAYSYIRQRKNLDEAIKIFSDADKYRFSEAIKVCEMLKAANSLKKM